MLGTSRPPGGFLSIQKGGLGQPPLSANPTAKTAGQKIRRGGGREPVRASRPSKSPLPTGLWLFFNLTALFPKLHILHLLAAFALEALADQRGILLEAPLFAVFGSVKVMAGEVLARQNL